MMQQEKGRRARRRFGAGVAAAFLLATPVLSADTAPKLDVFRNFAAGSWAMTRDGAAREALCLQSGTLLLTAGHQPHRQCSFVIVSNSPEEAVITYRCPTDLFGRTRVQRDTSRMYTVDAQGVYAGMPFSHRTEWRLEGACKAGQPHKALRRNPRK